MQVSISLRIAYAPPFILIYSYLQMLNRNAEEKPDSKKYFISSRAAVSHVAGTGRNLIFVQIIYRSLCLSHTVRRSIRQVPKGSFLFCAAAVSWSVTGLAALRS